MTAICPYCGETYLGSTELADHLVNDHPALAKAIFIQYFESLRGKGSSPEAEIAKATQQRALEEARNKFDILKEKVKPRKL